jgi:hypothetical protein
MGRVELGRIIESHPRRRWYSRWAGDRAKNGGKLMEGNELGVAEVEEW